jgi:serine/threonine protein kinase
VPFPGDNFVSVAMRHINEPPPSVRERRPELSPRLDAAIRRAMAKDPDDRFSSMEEFAAELRACLAEPDGVGAGPTDRTLAVSGQRRRPRRSPRRRRRAPMERPSVWPLIVLLAGLAVLAGIFAAVFALTGSPTKFVPAVRKATGGGNGGGGPVHLSGVTAYDPQGDSGEHNESVALATDGHASTYWRTQRYGSSSFGGLKDGVGLVLDAGKSQKLEQLTVSSDTPGFTAKIEAGQSSTGPFSTTVSTAQSVGSRTVFSIKGAAARYYVIWITELPSGGVAHVNEVTAKA